MAFQPTNQAKPQPPTDPQPQRPAPLKVPERDVADAESVFFIGGDMCRLAAAATESLTKESAWFAWSPDGQSLQIRSKETGEECSWPRLGCVPYFAPLPTWRAERDEYQKKLNAYEHELLLWNQRHEKAA